MAERSPHIGVAGLGYMGLATALAFAHRGRTVLGFEIVPGRRETIRSGRMPLHEAGLGSLLRAELRSGRFRVVDGWRELLGTADIVFLCLPTPPRPSGRIDLRPMRTGLNQLGRALRVTPGRKLIVVKSTVVPGTTEGFVAPALRRVSNRGPEELGVASSPEFLAEGTMLRDALNPDRIVVGTSSTADLELLRRAYRGFPSRIVAMSPTEAELVKYTANAALALKVTFANEVSRLAEVLGGDVDVVMSAVGLDPRIGSRFLSAGPGFGGSCFEKDLRALVARARELSTEPEVLRAVLRSNETQSRHAADLVHEALGGLEGKRVAVLGLAFKAGTDDVRETRALPLVTALRAGGAEVRGQDPVAVENFRRLWVTEGGRPDDLALTQSVKQALDGVDAAVIQVDWPEYRKWPRQWSDLMRRRLVVDLRRALPGRLRTRGDFEWRGLGVGRAPAAPDRELNANLASRSPSEGSRPTKGRGAVAR